MVNNHTKHWGFLGSAQFMAYVLTECYVSVVQVVCVCDAHCPEQVHGPVFVVGYISVA